MKVRGIRGAVQVEANTPEAILEAARRLITEMVRANGVEPDDVAAVIFTCTSDLDATFPAEAARALGWDRVPLLCSREMDVPGSMPRVVRVLMLVNTTLTQDEVVHVYLGGAERLRPDLRSAQ
ncbi:MAG: chorismate mutase [Armatimonadota bacterium]|nr:chorismate mutase [Armatimonadota bacterium]MDR7428876.1 chorismate mutase [Armatimonadota bacterium]MDR7431495.1 chorismate mutase [Armatimonadota bacterium]MDR7566174.1 chorismate mutase [Armatimonadota bacterium]MDR7580688.1 chorismate mutase [Armatimonadota bacterium]